MKRVFLLFGFLGIILLQQNCKTLQSKNNYEIDNFIPIVYTYIMHLQDDMKEDVTIPLKLDMEVVNENIRFKIYVEQQKKFIYKVQATIRTISEDNLPSSFDTVCVEGICYDVFLFQKGEKTDNDISRFQEEYNKYSKFYPYISNHLPVWTVDVYEEPAKVVWEQEFYLKDVQLEDYDWKK